MGAVLGRVSSPADVKKLNQRELDQLAQDLRASMIAATSINGGHLASSLGAVELILAAYRVLDLPHDKLLFDVGHQAYAHKMLTGRLAGFANLRQVGGVSGFTRRKESPFDVHDAGHASDSVATAVGLAIGRDLRGSDERIVTIIGDAALAGGLSLEAINLVGALHKNRFVIILNDNEMSISRSTGAFASYLAAARTSQFYRTTRDAVEGALSRTNLGAGLVELGEKAKASTKQFLVPGNVFESLGITYLGPIDGHDLRAVQDALTGALNVNGPVIIHTVTKKGKGYEPAERNPELFHGVSPFDPNTGKTLPKEKAAPSYTDVFGRELTRAAQKDGRIVAITAAMGGSAGLAGFHQSFPARFLDVGIAEECAVTTAAGLAIDGELPVVAIYSTFLQRAYDEIVTNVCLPGLHVVFAVDRAGLVGQDGSTHHGAFDMAYLRTMPNMRVIAPSDEAELASALKAALAMEGPVAIRYPRGAGEGVPVPEDPGALPTCARVLRPADGAPVRILAVGKMANCARRAAEGLQARGIACGVWDMRWVKPVDAKAVRAAAGEGCELLVTLEDGTLAGGFGSAVLECLADEGIQRPVLRLGLPDAFVGHGATSDLIAQLGLDPAGVAASIERRLADLRARG